MKTKIGHSQHVQDSCSGSRVSLQSAELRCPPLLTCRHVTLAQKKGANLPLQRAPWHSSHIWSSSTYGFTSTWRRPAYAVSHTPGSADPSDHTQQTPCYTPCHTHRTDHTQQTSCYTPCHTHRTEHTQQTPCYTPCHTHRTEHTQQTPCHTHRALLTGQTTLSRQARLVSRTPGGGGGGRLTQLDTSTHTRL